MKGERPPPPPEMRQFVSVPVTEPFSAPKTEYATLVKVLKSFSDPTQALFNLVFQAMAGIDPVDNTKKGKRRRDPLLGFRKELEELLTNVGKIDPAVPLPAGFAKPDEGAHL